MIYFIVVLVVVAIFVVSVIAFMRSERFGSVPAGASLERINASGNFKEGAFANVHNTPQLTEGATFGKVLIQFLFTRHPRKTPKKQMPSMKTDLHDLDPKRDVLVWFGHSSYYMQVDGKRILVDPVLSGNASPLSFTTKSFPGTDRYRPDDFPFIDYLIITHDHWDHLDYKTVRDLRPKVGRVITGLGTGAHLERWGYVRRIITELDWNEDEDLGGGFSVHTIPARHFSGRTFKRNGAIWLSMVLKTPRHNLFVGGDSGYDDHFAAAGAKYGPFDLAILENGQYDKHWKYIHMMPEETVQAAIDLKARRLLPLHWGKFALSTHPWDDSIIRVTKEAKQKELLVLHPMIGQVLDLNNPGQQEEWWKKVEG
jgi:L-ascorbate metabolism protein UlaG (beta-lactamase superfamily)